MDIFRNFLPAFKVFSIIMRLTYPEQIGMAFGLLLLRRHDQKFDASKTESNMFDIENLMHIGVFNQLIPIWQVFFFIATIFTEQPEKTKVRWVRYSQQADDAERPMRMHHADPVEAAINVTNVSDTER